MNITAFFVGTSRTLLFWFWLGDVGGWGFSERFNEITQNRYDRFTALGFRIHNNRGWQYGCGFKDLNFCSESKCFLFLLAQRESIKDPGKLAAAFATSVTAATDVGCGWIARKGAASLFRAMERILPQVPIILIFWFSFIHSRMGVN